MDSKKKIDSNKFQEIDGELYPIHIDADVFRNKGYTISASEDHEFDLHAIKEEDDNSEVVAYHHEDSNFTSSSIPLGDQVMNIMDMDGEGFRARTVECVFKTMCFITLKNYKEKAALMVSFTKKILPVKITIYELSKVLCEKDVNGLTKFLKEGKRDDYYSDAIKFLLKDQNLRSVIDCNLKELKKLFKNEKMKIRHRDGGEYSVDYYEIKLRDPDQRKKRKNVDLICDFIFTWGLPAMLIIGLFAILIYGIVSIVVV